MNKNGLETTVTRAQAIVEKNESILRKFFEDDAMGQHYNGCDHQLYLDLDDDTIMLNTEASINSWLQRDDNSLIEIHHVCGYETRASDEIPPTREDVWDWGYDEYYGLWLDMITNRITEALSNA